MRVTLEKFVQTLRSICAKETAAGGGKGWTSDNPTFGHCAVASLLVQDLFGGDLLRVSLEGTEFAEGRSHYFNRLPDGTVIDVTREQFQGRLPENLPAQERTREYVIGNIDTCQRYLALRARLLDALQ
jgi:hypothetical protein